MKIFSSVKWVPVALLATGFAAHAADLSTRPVYKAPVVMPDIVNWTGFYVGGNVGGKWSDFSSPISIATSPATAASSLPFGSDNGNSVIGGGQIGYNWQFGQCVIGVEGDADAQSLRHRLTLGATGNPALFVPGDSFQAKSDWQASARVRVGYAWDRWLVYATGGAAFTEMRVSTNFIATGGFPASAFSDSRTLTGGTIGGGVEYAFSRNLSFGVEGRYTDYGSSTSSLGTVAVFGPPNIFSAVTSRTDLSTWEVTGRLNWKFDWGAPIVAKY